MSWLHWSIVTTFLWTIQNSSMYYFTNIASMNAMAVNTFSRGIGIVCMICYILISGLSSQIRKNIVINIFFTDIFFIIVSSILMLLGNIFLYMSYSKMPHYQNASVATGISNICIIISTLLSYFFLNGTLSFSSGFGVIMCFIALSIATTGWDITKVFSRTDRKVKNKGDDKRHDDKRHDDKKWGEHDDHEAAHHTKYENSTWTTYALYSAVFYGFGMFSTLALAKYGIKLNSLSSSIMIIFIEFVIGILIYLLFTNKHIVKTYSLKKYGLHNYSHDLERLVSNKKFILNGILNGICEAFGLFGLINSYKSVSNGGMVDAITGGYAIIQALLLYAIYNTSLNMSTIVGLVTQCIGVYFIQK